jgi:hypothetical protein
MVFFCRPGSKLRDRFRSSIKGKKSNQTTPVKIPANKKADENDLHKNFSSIEENIGGGDETVKVDVDEAVKGLFDGTAPQSPSIEMEKVLCHHSMNSYSNHLVVAKLEWTSRLH